MRVFLLSYCLTPATAISQSLVHLPTIPEQTALGELISADLLISWGLGGFCIWLAIFSLQKARTHQRLLQQLLTDQEQQWFQARIEGQEQERERIAREIHDRLGSKLSTVKLRLSHLEGLDSNMEQHLLATELLLDQTVVEVQEISHALEGEIVGEIGLKNGLKELCEQLKFSHSLAVSLYMKGLFSSFSPNKQIALYRIVQEALTNVVKYARATQVSVSLIHDTAALSLVIEDNGIGFEVEQMPCIQGMGLRNMKVRARQLGGELLIESCPGQGTSILLHIDPKKNYG